MNSTSYLTPEQQEAFFETIASKLNAFDELLEALKTVRANLVRLAWDENTLMIEEIDAAIAKAGGQP